MDRSTLRKVRLAKYLGSGYFILLAFIYLVGCIADNNFDKLSFLLFIFTCLPVIFNKRWVYATFAFVYGLITFYIGLAVMIKGVGGSWAELSLTASILLLSAFCVMLLIYSSIVISKNRFSII